MPITIQAIYRKGTLQPKGKLNLPDETLVELQVTPLATEKTPATSLFGAFPELATFTTDDFAWAKRTWEHSLAKQSRLQDSTE